MENQELDEFAWANQELGHLIESVRSCMLATVSRDGEPLSSYAPFFINREGKFYVFVSALAKHYQNLKLSGKASLSLIEDEGTCEQLFARKRVTLSCEAARIERESEEWLLGMNGLAARHGEIVDSLRGMLDFSLFRLSPQGGRLVLGFGKAYQISGDKLSDITQMRDKGHRTKS